MGRCLQTWLSLARSAESLHLLHSPAQHGRGVRTSACLSMDAFDAIKAPTNRIALLAFHSDNQVWLPQRRGSPGHDAAATSLNQTALPQWAAGTA